MSGPRIRFGTNLITFFEPGWWGLDPDISYPKWSAAFAEDPPRYFERMLDAVAEAGLEGVELAPDPGGWQAALDAYGSTAALRSALDARGLTLTSSYAHGRQLIGDAIADRAAAAVAAGAFERHPASSRSSAPARSSAATWRAAGSATRAPTTRRPPRISAGPSPTSCTSDSPTS